MLEVKNWEVWGLERAVKASGNAMTTGEIDTRIDNEDKDIRRATKLGSNPVGSAHDHYLLGIHVQFDIKYPSYWTIEAERYHNFEIITSQSTMHRLTTMGKNENFADMFNKYVSEEVINIVKSYIDVYNSLKEMKPNEDGLYQLPTSYSIFIPGVTDKPVTKERYEQYLYEVFMKAISNLPRGFEMWMTCDLTYLQLKTIYMQRRNHKLKEDWGAFCDWCEQLPYFLELTGVKEKNDLNTLFNDCVKSDNNKIFKDYLMAFANRDDSLDEWKNYLNKIGCSS